MVTAAVTNAQWAPSEARATGSRATAAEPREPLVGLQSPQSLTGTAAPTVEHSLELPVYFQIRSAASEGGMAGTGRAGG